MIEIHIYNSRAYIVGNPYQQYIHNKRFNDDLRNVLSYKVVGADFSPKYKQNLWDGYKSVYSKVEKSFPSGCVLRVIEYLKENEIDYTIVDRRIKPPKNAVIKNRIVEEGKKLFFYQSEAANRALKKSRGVISMPTGSGKTITACELISRASTVPFIIFVPTLSLLKQTQRELQKYLTIDEKQADIGTIGENKCNINFHGVNVITYQTALSAFNKKYNELRDKIEISTNYGDRNRKTTQELEEDVRIAQDIYDKKEADLQQQNLIKREFISLIKEEKTSLKKAKTILDNRIQALKNKEDIKKLIQIANGFIVDEAHIAAVIIEELSGYAKGCYYRWGLSATPWREDNQEIRIEGAMGRKLIEITPSDLIKTGFLVPANIFMISIKHKEHYDNYADMYQKHIVNCSERNHRIKQFAEEFHKNGRPVLILVDKIEHGKILESMIENSVFVAGSDNEKAEAGDEEKDYRKRMLNKTEDNEIILIATQWAYVGIDAPKISVLIMACSIQSSVRVYQMIGRALRKAPNKKEAVIIDFLDSQRYLKKHGNTRKKIYENESMWKLNLI